MSLRILVTGATGKQGGACVNALLASSNTHDIYAITRTSKSPAAEKLAKRGVHVIEGNLDDPDSIFAKIDGVLDGVFLVQPSAGGGQTVDQEERQAKALFDVAQKVGVKHFVYASVPHGIKPTEVHHWASKHRIEEYITSNARISWTFLQPVCFMDNFVKGFQSRLLFAALEAWMGRGKPLDLIATEDIGNIAALVFADPQAYKGKSIPLSGDRLTVPQMQRIYTESSKANADATYHWIARLLFGWLVPDMGRMFRWFGEEGYPSNATTITKNMHPGVMSFETWAKRNLSSP